MWGKNNNKNNVSFLWSSIQLFSLSALPKPFAIVCTSCCVECLNEIEDQEALSHFQCLEVLFSQKCLEGKGRRICICMHQTEWWLHHSKHEQMTLTPTMRFLQDSHHTLCVSVHRDRASSLLRYQTRSLHTLSPDPCHHWFPQTQRDTAREREREREQHVIFWSILWCSKSGDHP